MSAKVLIVDDNELYRTAFRRNLMLRDYDVLEAENAEQALAVFGEQRPDVIVTDLSMRTPTEGLDLIRSIKQVEPLVPIVMISAVGTFEEGAEASRLGAHAVISKSRIDDEIESLYRTIESARAVGEENRLIRAEIDAITAKGDEADAADTARLREIIALHNLHPSIRGEAFDALVTATASELRARLLREMEGASSLSVAEAEATLVRELPGYGHFDPETRKELTTAEYFFQRQGGDKPSAEADFSRSIGFSFCFAVENEAKYKIRKRLTRFLGNKESIRLITKLVDKRTGQLDLFYHQHLARIQQVTPLDFTIDNVRQVFQRILEHESRYKPDGLKALGIVILCFGRDYEVKTMREKIHVANPFGLRGFESEQEVINFSSLLVSLQHFRNPYIHPEISEMEKVSRLREVSFECLRQISRLS
jgi:DNA-binding NarL/FixJ family response regulator